ncbi:MAG TPA: hypothetical protein VHP35_19385 [Terriglobia bacterium]|nr:hypothetical protein [Terriglobia bacterium]
MDTLTTATTGRRKPLKIYSWLRNLLVKEPLKGIAFATSFGIMVAGSSLHPGPDIWSGSPSQHAANATWQATEIHDDTALLADFQKRVQKYVELHRRLEKLLPPLELSDDPAKICSAIGALKRELRAARIKGKRGDIFTNDIGELFRRVILEALKDADPVELLAMFAEEDPNPTALPRVNASYPGAAQIAVMPGRILLALPELPEELRYSFMHRALILWDVHAELIVDFIPDAIPYSD